MTSLFFTSYLTCLFLVRTVLATDLKGSLHIYQERDFISTEVGENVTLPCFCNQSIVLMFSWYKQTLGQKLNLVANFYKYNKEAKFSDEYKNNPRYSLEIEDGKFHLTISDLQIRDSATYYCMGSSGNMLGFGEGTTVSVKGFGLSIKTLVHQPASEPLQPEDDVTLSCAVHSGNSYGAQSVYWYKSSEEPNPGLFYVNEGDDDQLEMKPNAQTCVYHLPIESRNQTHTGIKFCAVASCGHVLFGDGPELELKDKKSSPFSLVYILSGVLVSTTTLSLLLAFFVYKLKKRDHRQCTGSQTTTLAPATANAEGNVDADHLHYAALRKQTSNRPRRQTDDTLTECVYSSVKL